MIEARAQRTGESALYVINPHLAGAYIKPTA